MKLRMLKSALSLLALPVLFLAIPSSLYAQEAGDWAGTWKFSLEKSKFPGNPPLKDQVTVDPDGTITIDETNSSGKESSWHYKPEPGKTVPVIGRGENVTVIATNVNPHRTEQVWDFNGRKVTSYAVLSKDKKTQTFHMSGIDKDGKPFTEMVVYEKQ